MVCSFRNKEELADYWLSAANKLREGATVLGPHQTKKRAMVILEAAVLEKCAGMLRETRFETQMIMTGSNKNVVVCPRCGVPHF